MSETQVPSLGFPSGKLVTYIQANQGNNHPKSVEALMSDLFSPFKNPSLNNIIGKKVCQFPSGYDYDVRSQELFFLVRLH